MKRSLLVQFLLWSGIWLCAQERPPEEEEVVAESELPDWTEGELKELEEGGYVPGSTLIGALAREALESENDEPIVLTEAERALSEDEEQAQGDPRKIPEEFLPEYFQKAPSGFLNDPQELLTSQERIDLEKLLGYHTQDVRIDFYLYLFDEKQELPTGLDLEMVVGRHFDPGRPAAVVFYHLGAPRRSSMQFTQRVLEVASDAERSRVLWLAREEAAEKSDSSSQLEVFSTQLSIRLADLERVIRDGGRRLLPDDSFLSGGDGPSDGGRGKGWWSKSLESQTIVWGLVGVAVIGLAAILGWVGRWIAMKRRSYLFPDAEGSTLLDAPYAAGVGGVLSFASAQTPPSRQKSDVPDYLQRM